MGLVCTSLLVLMYFQRVISSQLFDLSIIEERSIAEDESKALENMKLNVCALRESLADLKEPTIDLSSIRNYSEEQLEINTNEFCCCLSNTLINKIEKLFISAEDSINGEKLPTFIQFLSKAIDRSEYELSIEFKNLKELFLGPFKNIEVFLETSPAFYSVKFNDSELKESLYNSIGTVEKCMIRANVKLKHIFNVLSEINKMSNDNETVKTLDESELNLSIKLKKDELSDLYDSILYLAKLSDEESKKSALIIKRIIDEFLKLKDLQKLKVTFYFEYTNAILPTIIKFKEDISKLLMEFKEIASSEKENNLEDIETNVEISYSYILKVIFEKLSETSDIFNEYVDKFNILDKEKFFTDDIILIESVDSLFAEFFPCSFKIKEIKKN